MAQAVWLGLMLAGTDALAGATSSDLHAFEVPVANIMPYLDALLVFSGGPIVLLVALASLAVPSLSPAISSSLPLLYRPYPRYRLRFQWALHLSAAGLLLYWLSPIRPSALQATGWPAVLVVVPAVSAAALIATLRTNPLYRALLVAGALTIGFSAIHVAHDVGLPTHHLLTAIAATMLTLIEGVLLVVLVVWLLRLRQSSDLIQGLVQMATNLIEHVARTEPGDLLTTQRPTVRDDLVCMFEEQEELKQLIGGLQQIGLRSLIDDQPVPALMVVRSIGAIQRASRVLGARRRDWLCLRDPASRQLAGVAGPWVEVRCIEALATVLLTSAEEHYFDIGRTAGGEIGNAALRHVRDDKGAVRFATSFRKAVVEVALLAYANGYDECIQFGEVNLSDELLAQFARLVNELLSTDDPDWQVFLSDQLTEWMVDAGRLAVSRDEVGAIRALLASVRSLRAAASTRDSVIGAVIELGAVALASRAYAVASVLLEWLERLNGNPKVAVGRIAIEFIRTQALNRSEDRPLEATATYMSVFLMLTVARGVSLRHRWDPNSIASVFELGDGMESIGERLRITCARLAASTNLPDEDAAAWRATLETCLGPREFLG